MSNNKQQTAVELFIEELEEKGKAYEENQVVRTINICIDVSDYMELKQQAKEMHKQEITQAWKKGDGQFDKVSDKMSLEYYNETYGEAEQF